MSVQPDEIGVSDMREMPPVQVDSARVDFLLPGTRRMHTVLKDVSFELNDSELLVLVGKSGCGKTTALNLLAGLLEPTEGTIKVLGKGPKEARTELGYMLARDALLPWRTAAKNVEFGLELRGLPRSERRRLAYEYLEMVNLKGRELSFPSQLSQGMRQRVALARTWAISPKLLLMDEPFAALDAQTRVSVQSEFIRLWQRDRRSVVFVTHDLQEAIIMADRILVFADGGIAGEFTVPFERPRDPLEIAADPSFEQLYREIRSMLSA